MAKNASKDGKFGKIMKIPLKILSKIRDFYMSSVIICDGQMGYGNYMGCPTPQVATLPKSFSISSSRSSNSDEDFRELVRAASTRKLGSRIEVDQLYRQKKKPNSTAGSGGVIMPRSFSVGIGRIDEDKPSEFGDDDVRVNTDLYPRSRSHAVSSKRTSVLIPDATISMRDPVR